MKKSYRTPRKILMVAHAINMGLFRKNGAVQGITRKEDWENIGYDIISGDFRKIGTDITITRNEEQSPHFLDKNDKNSRLDLFSHYQFTSEIEEINWIAQSIKKEIEDGLLPEYILITSICGNYENEYFENIKTALKNLGISSFIAGVDSATSIFTIEGYVTLSTIYRAKGNEKYRVYATRFQHINLPLTWKNENIIHKRNEAFVAITRAKIWCTVTGTYSEIFDEIDQALAQYPSFTFKAFNQASLQRVTEDI